MNPILTICIPVTRASSILKRCLESVHASASHPYTILLISKNKDGLKGSELKNAKTIQQKRSGLTGAMNDALNHINTPFFSRIDDDVTVSKTWMSTLVNTLMKEKHTGGLTGPTVIPADESNSRDVIRILTKLERTKNPLLLPLKWLYLNYLYEGKMRKPGRFLRSGVFTLGSNFPASLHLPEPMEVDYAEACNYTFRTQLVKKLGGFDQYYTYGLSEYHEPDMAYRIKQKGYHILFHPRAAVTHHIGTGVAKSRGEAWGRIRNFIRFYRMYLDDGSLDGRTRFTTHILLQNAYYMYKFVTTADAHNLGAILGTVDGLTTTIDSTKHDAGIYHIGSV